MKCKHCGDPIGMCFKCDKTLKNECSECHYQLAHGIIWMINEISNCGGTIPPGTHSEDIKYYPASPSKVLVTYKTMGYNYRQD